MLDTTQSKADSKKLDKFMQYIEKKNPAEYELHQAVREFAKDVIPFIANNPKYQGNNLLKRISEPDRIIIFRVTWEGDDGRVHVNRGYRVQHSNAIGP